MTLTSKVLLGLAAGLGVGIAISLSASPTLHSIPGYIEPIGTLWVNALRMIVLPLVVSAILIGVTSLPDARTIGRLGGRALLLFAVVLVAAAAFAVLVAPPIFSLLPIDTGAAQSLRASAAAASGQAVENASRITGLRQWLIDLIPTNPIRSAADGTMLPLIVFAIVFGLGLTRASPANRQTFMRAVNAVMSASLTVVRWVLVAAPVGVFAISVALATRLGLAAAGAVVYYIVAVSLMCVVFMALLYVVAVTLGRQPWRQFMRACAPAQAVAFSSRSSLVSLPAMLESSQAVLGLPLPIRSFFLPLAVATFRAGGAIGIPVGVLFLARLYGVSLDAQQLATVALVSVITTFSVPGIPGGSIIVMVPVLLSAGLPVDGVGLLLGVDTVPDMFRTTTNVTGDMAAATVLARNEVADASEPLPGSDHPVEAHPDGVTATARR
ncbi:MAG: dicarboxylate/amino acid:cation symporter [Longimicrobiales bacterium]